MEKKLKIEETINFFIRESHLMFNDQNRKTEDKIEFLKRLRSKTVDLIITKYFDDLQPRELFVLYLVRTILNNVFTDLGQDASFSFENVSKEFEAIAESLGKFIYLTLEGKGKKDRDALHHLLKSIENYHIALVKIEKEVMKIYSEPVGAG